MRSSTTSNGTNEPTEVDYIVMGLKQLLVSDDDVLNEHRSAIDSIMNMIMNGTLAEVGRRFIELGKGNQDVPPIIGPLTYVRLDTMVMLDAFCDSLTDVGKKDVAMIVDSINSALCAPNRTKSMDVYIQTNLGELLNEYDDRGKVAKAAYADKLATLKKRMIADVGPDFARIVGRPMTEGDIKPGDDLDAATLEDGVNRNGLHILLPADLLQIDVAELDLTEEQMNELAKAFHRRGHETSDMDVFSEFDPSKSN